jgi:type IV pilus assembly protein PilA
METTFIQKQVRKGFTLIELMVTIAIVSIIAVVAVALYEDYSVKAQVSEGFGLSDSIRVAEAEYYYNMGAFPTSLSTLGLTSPTGKYISSINLGDNGVITITYGNNVNYRINRGVLTLTPTVDTANVGIIHYECSGDGTILLDKYLPTVCANLTSSSSSSSSGSSNSSGSNTSTSSSGSSSSSDSSSSSSDSSSSTSSSDTLTAQQASEYPEVAQAYDRYNSAKAQVAAYQAQAAQYAQQAAAAQASGDMNSYNQLVGFEQNAQAQASNYQTQMSQAQTQYEQAVTIYTQRNNGTLPSDFPGAPS